MARTIVVSIESLDFFAMCKTLSHALLIAASIIVAVVIVVVIVVFLLRVGGDGDGDRDGDVVSTMR
jgi:hypothetical protein